MNYATFRGEQVQRQTCGRTACENDAIAFWQSRMTTPGARAEPIQLADLRELARSIRRAYADPITCEAAAPLHTGPASDTPNPDARNPTC